MTKIRIYVREALYPDGRLPEQLQDEPVPPLGIIGEVDEVASFNAVPRWNSIGSWTLEIPADSPQAKWFVSGRGIVVFKEGVVDPIYSGPIRKIQKSWDAEEGLVTSMVTVTGVDDNTVLAERLAWTNPIADIHLAAEWPRWQTDLSWPNVGVLLKHLIADNTNALIERQIPKLYIQREAPDLLPDNSPQTTLLKFNQIDQEIEKLTSVYGFRISCIWHPNPYLIADAFDPSEGPGILVRIEPVHDLTNRVQFGPHLGNLQAYEYEVEAPSATRPVIGAQNRTYTELLIKPTYDQSDTPNGYTEQSTEKTGPERYYAYYQNDTLDPDWWGDEVSTPADMQWTLPYAQRGLTFVEVQWGVTAERFVDLSSVDWQWRQAPNEPDGWPLDPPEWSKQFREFQTSVEEFHASNGPKAAIKFTPLDVPENVQVLEDYWLGDLVRSHIDGEIRDEVFREAEITVTSDGGHHIKPVVGSDGTTNTPYLYRQIKAIWSEIQDADSPTLSEAEVVPTPQFGFVRVEES